MAKTYGEMTKDERDRIIEWSDHNRETATKAGVMCFVRDRYYSNKADKTAEADFKKIMEEVYPLVFG